MVKLLIFLFIISLLLLVLLFVKIDKNRTKESNTHQVPKSVMELDLEIELLQATIDLKLSRIQKENPEKVTRLKSEIAQMENEIAEAERQRAILTKLK